MIWCCGKQQIPPLRRRWRSGSGRNDKAEEIENGTAEVAVPTWVI